MLMRFRSFPSCGRVSNCCTIKGHKSLDESINSFEDYHYYNQSEIYCVKDNQILIKKIGLPKT